MIGPATFVAIYFVVWWICLFVVLPFGVRNQVDTGEYVQGTERGAPLNPMWWKRVLWTTLRQFKQQGFHFRRQRPFLLPPTSLFLSRFTQNGASPPSATESSPTSRASPPATPVPKLRPCSKSSPLSPKTTSFGLGTEV